MRRAGALFPGGVSSPVRAFRGVGGEPFVVARGEGSRIWDVDGREYIDYVLSWGPLVVGHASPGTADRNRTLSLRNLGKIEVPVPRLAAQQGFVTLQSTISTLKARHAAIREANAALLAATLERVFTRT